MVLQQQLPGGLEQPGGVLAAVNESRVGGQRLPAAREQRLRLVVGLLENHPSRPDAAQDVMQLAGEEFAGESTLRERPNFLDELAETGVTELDFGKRLAQGGEHLTELLLHREVVATVVEQPDVPVSALRHLPEQLADLGDRA